MEVEEVADVMTEEEWRRTMARELGMEEPVQVLLLGAVEEEEETESPAYVPGSGGGGGVGRRRRMWRTRPQKDLLGNVDSVESALQEGEDDVQPFSLEEGFDYEKTSHLSRRVGEDIVSRWLDEDSNFGSAASSSASPRPPSPCEVATCSEEPQ